MELRYPRAAPSPQEIHSDAGIVQQNLESLRACHQGKRFSSDFLFAEKPNCFPRSQTPFRCKDVAAYKTLGCIDYPELGQL